VATAKGGQGGIGELQAGLGQLLVHPRDTAFALLEELPDVVAMVEGLFRARQPGHLR
jgi:hypothetical protein